MIVYDLMATQPMKNAVKHGGGKFAERVFYKLVERGVQFIALYDATRPLEESIIENVRLHKIKLLDVNNGGLDSIMSGIDNPIIYSILPKEEMFKYKTVGTIHDCRGIDEPLDVFQFRYRFSLRDVKLFLLRKFCRSLLFNRRIKQMDRFVSAPNFYPTTISYFTKYKLYSLLGNSKVLEMPIFYTPSYYKNVEGTYNDNNYALMVSGNRWIKNNLRAIIALDIFFTKFPSKDFKAIVTGVENPSIFKYKIINRSNFVFKPYVGEEELTKLYSECSFFVFPSLYEGFGMPPLEAMNYSKPVLASHSSSITEICGGAAIYFDPYSIDDILEKLIMISFDKELYKKISKKSKDRFVEFLKLQENALDKYVDHVINVERLQR